MEEPAYVSIAGQYARKIRNGDLPPGVQLPSYSEIAKKNGVSDIVVRKAVELLQSQGLVRTVQRRGVFVTDRPNLVRVSPERQMESAETTFTNESSSEVQVERDSSQVPATSLLAEAFGIDPGDEITLIVTRATEDGRPISISDTYLAPGITDTSSAATLKETIADRIPTPTHAAWLETPAGELTKTVHQRFFTAEGRTIMVSDVTYPWNRYDAFTFRMPLR
ncbi:GntR family transcriptional regulator [Micromonospora sp. NBC_01813]|jgi:GntR family transcriptional regulator|uniref:GntR family transcriptional regulator n=1 Tax=Micromonospora sp. NBC_01813 TaxID=2975988 RepID=UPI002DDB5745|nr:GntR family transcriptional regulator [Micromonospora sp. NBC_01813]WSA06807.1 GntR family transcriptional regulator [Micromonospora sp. NBC_01813]